MTAITKTAAPVSNPSFAGKAGLARAEAFGRIATLSFSETISRDACIANLRIVLGPKPTPVQLASAKAQWIIGRVAARLTAGTYTGKDLSPAACIAFASDVVLHFASPAKDGVAARKLRKGQKGRRSIAQHKLVRAAEEAWSQVKAELGEGKAKTQAERNKGRITRKPRTATTATPPTHAQLVAAPKKAANANDACGYLESMAATMLAFSNKNAALLPTDYGTAVKAFKRAIDDATKARAAK